jgi:hypothetical protein
LVIILRAWHVSIDRRRRLVEVAEAPTAERRDEQDAPLRRLRAAQGEATRSRCDLPLKIIARFVPAAVSMARAQWAPHVLGWG